ncbi:hypothetical protein [Streptomyces sp. N2A]|nr:hypothetical protein [Streptomyces sp. N2A]
MPAIVPGGPRAPDGGYAQRRLTSPDVVDPADRPPPALPKGD